MEADGPTGDSIHIRVAAARLQLHAAGLTPDEAALDARLLAQHLLGWDTARMLACGHDPATPAFTARYAEAVGRRARREPLAYITGTKEFWGLGLDVTPDVLIPRPETELVVEQALALFPGTMAPLALADVCTGSGCIAVALARERPRARITASDLSGAALRVAERNAVRHGVSERVRFVEGDLLNRVEDGLDLIVANPPYVPEGDRPGLQTEVGEFEPAMALFAGPLGLDVIERLVEQSASHLRPGGALVFEFGAGQDQTIARLISQEPRLTMERVVRDLAGIPRVAVATR
jgi:release factor glutamine methyltransferase